MRVSQGSLQDWEVVDSRAPGSTGQIQERLSGLARPWMEAGGVPVVIPENFLDMIPCSLQAVTGSSDEKTSQWGKWRGREREEM